MPPSGLRGSGAAGTAVPPTVTGRRILSRLLVAAGLLVLAWTLVAWRWDDPLTALYARHRQHELSRQLAIRGTEAAARATGGRSIAVAARRYRLRSHDGEAMARISIPRIGLDAVVVEGTTESDLEQGPGFYAGDFLPGEGQLVYVAGHRTTYSAPFSHLDRLRPGDAIAIALPYGTFTYTVTGHRIVTANDIAVLRSHRREQLILQTCHPRFSATHRYLVFALPKGEHHAARRQTGDR